MTDELKSIPNFVDIIDKVKERLNLEFAVNEDGVHTIFNGIEYKLRSSKAHETKNVAMYFFMPVDLTKSTEQKILEFRLSTSSLSFDGFNNIKYPRTEEEKKLVKHKYWKDKYTQRIKERRQESKPVLEKVCVHCGKTFTTKNNSVLYCCDECRKEYMKAYMKEYREENRDKINEYSRNFRKTNPNRARAILKKYAESDKGKATRKAYYSKKKEKVALDEVIIDD